MKIHILALMAFISMGAALCADGAKTDSKSHAAKSHGSSFIGDVAQVTAGLVFCAIGVYALLQAKQSFDDEQGIFGKASKAKTKVSQFWNGLIEAQEDPVDSFYAENKHKILTTGWAVGGIASLAIGLKLIMGSSHHSR